MCDEKLVTVDEFPQIELSVCSTVVAYNTGTDQGFQKCSSSSKHTPKMCICTKWAFYVILNAP